MSRDPWNLEERVGREPMQEKELLVLFLKERKQEKKGKVATQDCNMASAVFLSHTAVILTKRSSSHPCGVRLESPNLSAALPNVVAYGGSRPHIASVVMTVYMPCSS